MRSLHLGVAPLGLLAMACGNAGGALPDGRSTIDAAASAIDAGLVVVPDAAAADAAVPDAAPAPPVAWQARVAAGPSARQAHAMAWDAARQQVVLVGGLSEFGAALDDTWVWDGAAWTLAAPAGGVLTPRYVAGLAYDAGRERVVLFGGFGPAPLSDTFEWDGSAWTEVVVASAPPGRAGPAMAYDAAAGHVVMFGGTANPAVLDDTWTFDGTAWTQLAVVGPAGRYMAGLTPAAGGAGLIAMGGVDAGGVGFGDTWRWDGAAWTELDAPIAARWSHGMATGLGRIVSFGMQDATDPATYGFDGASWTNLALAPAPPARGWSPLVFDATRSEFVLFGGYAPTLFDDTWVLAVAP